MVWSWSHSPTYFNWNPFDRIIVLPLPLLSKIYFFLDFLANFNLFKPSASLFVIRDKGFIMDGRYFGLILNSIHGDTTFSGLYCLYTVEFLYLGPLYLEISLCRTKYLVPTTLECVFRLISSPSLEFSLSRTNILAHWRFEIERFYCIG